MRTDFRRFKRQIQSMSTDERFWFKVSGDSFETCWEWMGKLDHSGKGYGTTTIDGKTIGAHRYAYERLIAEIPEGLDLDHICRNTACVNPWHLEPVTRKVNLHRSPRSQATLNSAKVQCKRGHPFTEGNTYWRNDGTKRECRTCRADYAKAWRESHLGTPKAA